MTNRSKLLVLVIAQSACLACGLAFYYLYVASSLRRTAEERTWSQLIQDSKQLSHRLAGLDVTGDKKQLRQAFDQLRAGNESSHVRAALVDAAGRPIPDPMTSAATDGSLPVSWLRSSAPWGAHNLPIRGTIRTPRGPRLAVASPLASQSVYLLLTEEGSAAGLELGDVTQALWVSGGITFVWTTGVFAAVVYLLLTRFVNNSTNKQLPPNLDALKNSEALVRTQETVIFGLAKLADSRDPETGGHLDRISAYSSLLASAMRQHPDFRHLVTPTFVRLISISSALHDIGKVGVEDAILRKPGSLSQDERERMKKHTNVGEDCLREIEHRLGTSNFLQMAREIASSHHERWDGTGYPLGLAGENIPLAARIVALADVYDALASRRVYKVAFSHEVCKAIIVAEAGKHFDPRLVEVFLKVESSFRNIARQFEVAGDEGRPQETAAETPIQCDTDFEAEESVHGAYETAIS